MMHTAAYFTLRRRWLHWGAMPLSLIDFYYTLRKPPPRGTHYFIVRLRHAYFAVIDMLVAHIYAVGFSRHAAFKFTMYYHDT